MDKGAGDHHDRTGWSGPQQSPGEDVDSVRRRLAQDAHGPTLRQPAVVSNQEVAPHHEVDFEPAVARRSTGWSVAGRFLIGFLAVIALSASGVAWSIFNRADNVVEDREIEALVPDDPNLRTPGASPPVSGQESPSGSSAASATGSQTPGTPLAGSGPVGGVGENILLIGADTRTGAERAQMSTSQSDVLMLAHVGAGGRTSVMSIPRDTAVPAPTCKRWNDLTGEVLAEDYPAGGDVWKITNAYAVGGPQCTVRAVQALTGIRIDRVVMIDFVGFKAMVDALGGVTMTFDQPLVDNGKTIIGSAGTHVLNGEQALAVVRARKVAGDSSGDLGRAKRQQQVLSALLSQVASTKLVLNPGKLDSVLQAFVQNTRTANMGFGQLLDFAKTIGAPDAARPVFFTVPTQPIAGSERLALGPGADAIFTAIVNDQPVPGS